MTELFEASSEPAILSRRRTVIGGLTGGIVASSVLLPTAHADSDTGSHDLPVKEIEHIMQASGKMRHGVLTISMNRTDLKSYLPGNIPITPAELLNSAFYFQSVSGGKAFMNGNVCVTLSEIQPFITALIKNGLTVQAFHQHLPDMKPMYWFIHFRGEGPPKALAQAIRDAVGATAQKLPQYSPKHQPTPFDKKKLEDIVGGHATVGSSGVITVSVDRAEQMHLGGVRIHRGLGVAATIAFQPLDPHGTRALAIPDFAMIAPEVDNVFKVMQAQGFYIGCLYNQETDEQPQLYFSHMWATGDVYDLAKKIRKGLDQTKSKFKS